MVKKNELTKATNFPLNVQKNFFHKTVLVVEDDRSHRSFIENVLKACGFQTVHADNGFAALSEIDTGQHFDLILLDLDMPKLDGYETAKAIRAREVKENGTTHRPVIAFTSKRNPNEREKCIASGMDAYLPKDALLPKWRVTLIDNLQGLIAGNFDLQDFSEHHATPEDIDKNFDINDFDIETFEQASALLKDEIEIAIEEYLEDAAAYIREIETGIHDSDFDKISRGSHPLKSNSKSFGLMSVSKISEAINVICERGEHNPQSLQKIKGLFLQLEEAFEFAQDRLQEELRAISG